MNTGLEAGLEAVLDIDMMEIHCFLNKTGAQLTSRIEIYYEGESLGSAHIRPTLLHRQMGFLVENKGDQDLTEKLLHSNAFATHAREYAAHFLLYYILRHLKREDIKHLEKGYEQLCDETKKRFEKHMFKPTGNVYCMISANGGNTVYYSMAATEAPQDARYIVNILDEDSFYQQFTKTMPIVLDFKRSNTVPPVYQRHCAPGITAANHPPATVQGMATHSNALNQL